MAVFRVERNKGYTVMSNHHLRNKELSLKAKGLLSQMLSLPEDWDYTLKGLCCGGIRVRLRSARRLCGRSVPKGQERQRGQNHLPACGRQWALSCPA